MTTSPPPPLRLHLVRHGETEWSRSGQHTGRTELLLTTRGEDESRQLAPRLRDTAFTQVFTSPRQRARQTCVLAGLGPGSETEPDLAEWDYGDYEGQRSADIRETRAGWNIFRDGCPNGETPEDVADRADRLIARLRTMIGNVALFSHGHFSCVLAARWIGLPLIEARHFLLGTASLSILGEDPHHTGVAVIALWNATSQESSSPAPLPEAVEQEAIERWGSDEDEGAIQPGPDAGLLKISER